MECSLREDWCLTRMLAEWKMRCSRCEVLPMYGSTMVAMGLVLDGFSELLVLDR